MALTRFVVRKLADFVFNAASSRTRAYDVEFDRYLMRRGFIDARRGLRPR